MWFQKDECFPASSPPDFFTFVFPQLCPLVPVFDALLNKTYKPSTQCLLSELTQNDSALGIVLFPEHLAGLLLPP